MKDRCQRPEPMPAWKFTRKVTSLIITYSSEEVMKSGTGVGLPTGTGQLSSLMRQNLLFGVPYQQFIRLPGNKLGGAWNSALISIWYTQRVAPPSLSSLFWRSLKTLTNTHVFVHTQTKRYRVQFCNHVLGLCHITKLVFLKIIFSRKIICV
jgi:hypothetical protein